MTAPEMTAGSYPNNRPPSVATNVSPITSDVLTSASVPFFPTFIRPPQVASGAAQRAYHLRQAARRAAFGSANILECGPGPVKSPACLAGRAYMIRALSIGEREFMSES